MTVAIVRRALAAAALGLLLAPAAHAEKRTVEIRFFHFSPDTLDVKPGDEVEWVNRDLLEHTVTAANSAFDSKGIKRGDTWTWKATAPGQYPYACAFHGNMKGVINVRE